MAVAKPGAGVDAAVEAAVDVSTKDRKLADWRWLSASANASAASGESGGLFKLNSRATMSCTCRFCAAPEPVTASFTSFGLYKKTGIPARAAVNNATPLA